MNTNSIPETQTAKAKDEMIFGSASADYDDKYALFTLPKGHVIYVVDKDDFDAHWIWYEERVYKTEVQMNTTYSKMTIYTEEGNKYTLEVDAFMTVQGAMAACESRETFDMQQRDIEHLNDIIDLKEMRTYPDD